MKLPVCRALSFLTLLFVTMPLAAQDSKLLEFLPEKLEDAKGKKIETAQLQGKFIGLYFSAGWCPPCRAFTPHLVKFRNENSDKFEVIFVSFDKSNTDKQRYIRKNDMPWPSISGAGRKDSKALSNRFQIQGLPSLVIVNPDGKVITLSGRGDVQSNPETALETWKKANQS